MIRISPTATKAGHSRLCLIDSALVSQKASDSRKNERRREIHTFHDGDGDTLQRMLNALQPSSYIRPHRHIRPPKAEALLLIQGSLAFVAFKDDGDIEDTGLVLLDPKVGKFGVDYRAGTWHTFFALTPDTVIFEVKPGPYDAATDKEFAPWAPDESSDQGVVYLAGLDDRFRKHFQLPPRSWELKLVTRDKCKHL